MQREVNCSLSAANLLHNVEVVKAQAPQSKIMAMVKSDAYGHGMLEVARRLEGRVDALGVASLDEAMELREAGIETPIALVYGAFSPEELRQAFDEGFIVSFHNSDQIAWLKELERQKVHFPKKIQAFLGLETGMEREGFQPKDAGKPFKVLSESPLIEQPVGIQSHFASADASENEQNKKQIATFRAFTKKHKGPKSFCNSAATFAFPEEQGEWIRPGLALYGVSPFDDRSAESLGLKPVMNFQSRLIDVRDVKKGNSVGYGGNYKCPEDMKVGIVPAGYGDGYPHAGSLQETRSVLVNGKPCSVIGSVCMNALMVDLRGCPGAAAGNTVTLWGEGLPIKDVANVADRIPYDVLTNMAHGARAALKWDDEPALPTGAENEEKNIVSGFRYNATAFLREAMREDRSDVTSDSISIRGIPKDVLFAALYNRTKPFWIDFDLSDPNVKEPCSFSASMTAGLAKRIIEEHGISYSEYMKIFGDDKTRHYRIGDRPQLFSIETNILYTGDYDRRNGAGAAKDVIAALRTGQPPPEHEANPTSAIRG